MKSTKKLSDFDKGFLFVEDGIRTKILENGLKKVIGITKQTLKELHDMENEQPNVKLSGWVRGGKKAMREFLERHK